MPVGAAENTPAPLLKSLCASVDPRIAWYRGQDTSPFNEHAISVPSKPPSTIRRWSLERAISTRPGERQNVTGSKTERSGVGTLQISIGRKTAVSVSSGDGAKLSSFSQLNNWFAFIAKRRATCETDTPGAKVCKQTERFSSSLQERCFRRAITNPLMSTYSERTLTHEKQSR